MNETYEIIKMTAWAIVVFGVAALCVLAIWYFIWGRKDE